MGARNFSGETKPSKKLSVLTTMNRKMAGFCLFVCLFGFFFAYTQLWGRGQTGGNRPIMEYAAPVWSGAGTTCTSLFLLDRLQKRVLRRLRKLVSLCTEEMQSRSVSSSVGFVIMVCIYIQFRCIAEYLLSLLVFDKKCNIAFLNPIRFSIY